MHCSVKTWDYVAQCPTIVPLKNMEKKEDVNKALSNTLLKRQSVSAAIKEMLLLLTRTFTKQI